MSTSTLIAAFFIGATIGAVWQGVRGVDRAHHAGYRLGRMTERARTAARAGNLDQGQGGRTNADE